MNFKKRIIAYIDGFNLYHAVKNLKKNHLKWIDLRMLSQRYVRYPDQSLSQVKYFSAYATWKPEPFARHRAYVKALKAAHVEFVKGRFKEKDRFCKRCKRRYTAHEEKETDVNLALHLLNDAYHNAYDHAILMTADSDISPAVKLVKNLFPEKLIYIVHPPKLNLPKELIWAAGGYKFCKEIRESHISDCLFPEKIFTENGQLVVCRPPEYDPPIM